MDKYDYDEQYADYEAAFSTNNRDRKRKNRRKARMPRRMPAQWQELHADDAGILFDPSYMRHKPENEERMWLIKHVTPFYQEDFIADVIAVVKGGKEAAVYRCAGHDSLAMAHVAAKIYRPAITRSLKNDALYREGRLGDRTKGETAESLIGGRESRAMKRGTDFGKRMKLSVWIAHEFSIMNKLYNAGISLPQPIAHKGNAILMAYIGDPHQPAPPLHYISLDDGEAQPLFDQILADIRQMLKLEIVHGDLSPYNVLYWAGKMYLIDFPQTVNPIFNNSAYQLLERDVARMCNYFAKYGVVDEDGKQPYASEIAGKMWQRFWDNNL